MIELPEAEVIAHQIGQTLAGKRIAAGEQGNAAHKFAFYSGENAFYQRILKDKVISGAQANGRMIRVALEPDYILVLGEGGETILYHASAASLPARCQLRLCFSDDTWLSVSIQGWGAALLLHRDEIEQHPFAAAKGLSPLDDGFTYGHFSALFSDLKPGDTTSPKQFLITKPGVAGVGNGMLQDILLAARLHPRRRMAGLSEAEKQALYRAVREVMLQAVQQGGRDSEKDLFGNPGGYRKLLDSRSVGLPCPQCGAEIQKENYLGGAVYFCPRCQALGAT